MITHCQAREGSDIGGGGEGAAGGGEDAGGQDSQACSWVEEQAAMTVRGHVRLWTVGFTETDDLEKGLPVPLALMESTAVLSMHQPGCGPNGTACYTAVQGSPAAPTCTGKGCRSPTPLPPPGTPHLCGRAGEEEGQHHPQRDKDDDEQAGLSHAPLCGLALEKLAACTHHLQGSTKGRVGRVDRKASCTPLKG